MTSISTGFEFSVARVRTLHIESFLQIFVKNYDLLIIGYLVLFCTFHKLTPIQLSKACNSKNIYKIFAKIEPFVDTQH